MSRNAWHPPIESALCLNLATMMKQGALRPGHSRSGVWCWTQGDQIVSRVSYSSTLGDINGQLRLSYTWTYPDEPQDVVCAIPLSSRPLPYGGRYWYMHCPGTGRRARKLYKYGCLKYFLHRTAIHPLPTYASQRVSGSDRIAAQRWALRRRIGDDYSNLFGEQMKPKWMRWRTFERYAARDAELADRQDYYLCRFVSRLVARTGG